MQHNAFQKLIELRYPKIKLKHAHTLISTHNLKIHKLQNQQTKSTTIGILLGIKKGMNYLHKNIYMNYLHNMS